MRRSKVQSDSGGDPVESRTQREILRDVLLSATECGTWLTLDELAETTCYGQASISAQLRHLRKQEFGGYTVEKRRREAEETQLAIKHERVYEYQLKRTERKIPVKPRVPVTTGAEVPV